MSEGYVTKSKHRSGTQGIVEASREIDGCDFKLQLSEKARVKSYTHDNADGSKTIILNTYDLNAHDPKHAIKYIKPESEEDISLKEIKPVSSSIRG